MVRSTFLLLAFLLTVSFTCCGPQAVSGQEKTPVQEKPAAAAETAPATEALRRPDPKWLPCVPFLEALVAAYNAGDAAKLAACFMPKAELVDDAGNVYRGLEEIRGNFSRSSANSSPRRPWNWPSTQFDWRVRVSRWRTARAP